MFANHQPIIAAYARSAPEAFARVARLSMLSAHTPFYNLGADIEAIEQGRPEDAQRTLYGRKHGAYIALGEQAAEVLAFCESAARDYDGADLALVLLDKLASLPGLGLIKGGFICQMAYGVGGCLDTHNLKRYGYSAREFRGDKFKECQPEGAARMRRLRRYVDAVYLQGGPRVLWDNWCELQAQRYPKLYASAWEVSAMHCRFLGLPETQQEGLAA